MNLLGQGLLAEAASRTMYKFARLDAFSEWWHWLAFAAICVGLASYALVMYLRDGAELPRGLVLSLLVLRVAALAGLVFYFLQLEKRTEQRLVRNSRVLVLVDTSQSMTQRDTERGRSADAPRRIDQIIAEFASGSLLADLRQQHEVVVYRLAASGATGESNAAAVSPPVSIASFAKIGSETPEAEEATESPATGGRQEMQTVLGVGGGLLGVALLLAMLHFVSRRPRHEEATAWLLLGSMVLLIGGLVTSAVAHLRHPELGWLGMGEAASSSSSADAAGGQSATAGDEKGSETTPALIDWAAQLAPTGSETRLLDAVRFLINKERGGTVAGVIVLSDGGNNAGLRDSAVVIQAAKDAHLPVYAIGMGSSERPKNVRLVDLEAPLRAYPNDPFPIKGYVQGFGVTGSADKPKTFPVEVELISVPMDGDRPGTQERVEGKATVQLKAEGVVEKVEFTVDAPEVGQRLYTFRQVGKSATDDKKAAVPAASTKEAERQGLLRTAKVQIIKRKNKVLLLAGGPTREYQFLRNQLYRDKQTTVHVLLQTGKPGQSQDAHDLLYDFPSNPDELFDYDCLVAFDFDWSALDTKPIELLERYVAEKAGGLIVVAGPVHTPRWTNTPRGEDAKIDILKGLYPVVFYSQGNAGIKLGRFGAEQAWPLKFTPEGEQADFLWIADNARKSAEAWNAFPGVFGYYSIKDVKPGASVYAYFSEPDTAVGGQLPVYFASQYYGTGRVFYMASGEMWRMRSLDEKYFEQFYTKLIRWTTQGRLLRDSSRGVILADKERAFLGETITIRASLTDPQHQPLTVAEVSALLIQPDGKRVPLVLKKTKDASRQGMYSGQFAAAQEGDFRVELPLPGGDSLEVLKREVRVRMPTLEIERPERDDALLSDLSVGSGGAYYVGLNSAHGHESLPPLIEQLVPQDQQSFLPGSPDQPFNQMLMGWMIGGLCTVLCLEWLIRRLNKLA